MSAITEQTRINTSTRLVANDVRSAIQPGLTTLITDAAEHTGPFFAVTAILASTIDHSGCTTNIINGADFILPEGVTVYGKFDSIALLAGGSVMAYTL
tara:strand:+ start:104 stop:397 length:294 start_codon:yes stop_codon:yes gene_type:complete